MTEREALGGWVNWNPDPELHAYGTTMPRGTVVAMCGTTVREESGWFDPTNPRACSRCTDFVGRRLSFAEARQERAGRPLPPNSIVCRRPT